MHRLYGLMLSSICLHCLPVQEETPPSWPNDKAELFLGDRWIWQYGEFFDLPTEIPSFMPKVKTLLAMPKGGLEKLPFKAFCHVSHLEILFLSNHQLVFVDSGAFLCLDNLTILTLCRCEITYLLNGTFRMLHRLLHLDLTRKCCTI